MKLSIVIPCYNEKENLSKLECEIKKCSNYDDIEFLLVNNGSTDGSNEILKRIEADNENVKLVVVEINQGYGFGIKQGINKAEGVYVGWLHADLQVSLKEVIKVYNYLDNNEWEEVYFIKGIRSRDNRKVSEQIFTFLMGMLSSVILGRLIVDTNGIPTVIPKRLYDSIKNDTPDDVKIELFIYDAAQKKGLVQKRLKVNYRLREKGYTKLLPDMRSKISTIKSTILYLFKLKDDGY